MNKLLLFALLLCPAAEALSENDFVPVPENHFFSEALSSKEPDAKPLPGESQDEMDRRIGPWLDLRGGGIAVGSPQGAAGAYGTLERAQPLPASGPGFHRRSREEQSYGTGFMISLLEKSGEEYARTHDGELLQVGGIALPTGGLNAGHKSHQNGLDADILFMGAKDWKSVLDKNGKVTERFQPQKNWDYWRMVTNQKIVTGGKERSIVSMILVAPELKTFLCEWTKQGNMLSDPLNQEVMKRLRSTEGHDDHFHIRLLCSPYHEQCDWTWTPKDLGCT